MSDATKNLQEKLTPKHLLGLETPEPPPSDADLKGSIEAASAPAVPEKDPDAPNPRGEKVYTFNLDYKDARGKVWKGSFTTKILSIHERSQAGAMRAMLGAGQPLNSFDGLTAELNLMVSHMAYSLTDKPDWAENLRALEDPGLLQAIFAEVDSHESFFLGWDQVEGAGQEKSG